MPTILTTWSFAPIANAAGLAALAKGASALDAAVAAATAVELDPSIASVGLGGIPDADGQISLDACVMTNPDRCGSVAYVRAFATPAAIAQRVMERTIHVMLVGEGAERFAAREGFQPRPLLTQHAIEQWDAWRKGPDAINRDAYRGWLPPPNVEESPTGRTRTEPDSHDTVSILVRDDHGQLAGVCSTSGMAFKVPGRVGDSPIIGHGLYVDQAAGAAAATGTGELIMGVCASFLAVELMRAGAAPSCAIESVLKRIESRYRLRDEHQVALIAMTPTGAWASGALRPGFTHGISDHAGTRVEPPTLTLRTD